MKNFSQSVRLIQIVKPIKSVLKVDAQAFPIRQSVQGIMNVAVTVVIEQDVFRWNVSVLKPLNVERVKIVWAVSAESHALQMMIALRTSDAKRRFVTGYPLESLTEPAT